MKAAAMHPSPHHLKSIKNEVGSGGYGMSVPRCSMQLFQLFTGDIHMMAQSKRERHALLGDEILGVSVR